MGQRSAGAQGGQGRDGTTAGMRFLWVMKRGVRVAMAAQVGEHSKTTLKS